MNKTKDQQAQEYVLNRQTARHNAKTDEDATMRDFDKTVKAWDSYDMEQAFEDGYTACEQSMWRSVEEELPEFGQKVIHRAECESMYGEKFVVCENLTFESNKYFVNSFKLRESADKGIKLKITHWMPIPSLPETNTK